MIYDSSATETQAARLPKLTLFIQLHNVEHFERSHNRWLFPIRRLLRKAQPRNLEAMHKNQRKRRENIERHDAPRQSNHIGTLPVTAQ